MTLKSDSSQPSHPKKINIWISRQSRRQTNWRRRASMIFLWGFLAGIIMSLVFALTRGETQTLISRHFSHHIDLDSFPRLVERSIAQTTQWLEPTSTTVMPRATTGLAEPKLWGHAATLSAYLGHFPYLKATSEQLIGFSDPSGNTYHAPESLHPDAALALATMIQDAKAAGVSIVLTSGFRDFASQEALFQARAQAYGSEEEAAKVVAPPGYSEHHTGYAIDVSDGSGQVFSDFAETRAYQWMQIHAQDYGFELSFPQGNSQGVDFEPWHWRFVGSPEAQQLFAPARSRYLM